MYNTTNVVWFMKLWLLWTSFEINSSKKFVLNQYKTVCKVSTISNILFHIYKNTIIIGTIRQQ